MKAEARQPTILNFRWLPTIDAVVEMLLPNERVGFETLNLEPCQEIFWFFRTPNTLLVLSMLLLVKDYMIVPLAHMPTM